jgi:DNA-binding beta-propeller fold protein YncE
VIHVNLPTEDLGLMGTYDYYGDEEIISMDTGVGGNREVGSTEGYLFDDEAAQALEGVLSSDGRYAYTGHKSNPYIMILDTQTGTVDAVALIDPPAAPYPTGWAGQLGSVDSVVMSPDNAFLYASVLDGMHPYDASGCADGWADEVQVRNKIMKIKVSTMEVVSELDVTPPAAQTCQDAAVLKRLSMSSDGSVGAVALFNRGRVAIVNLNDMTLTKSLIVNGVANDKTEPHYTAVSPNGSKVYVAYNNNDDGGVDVIDTSDYSMSNIELSIGKVSDRTHDMKFGPDGRLYLLRDDNTNPLFIFDVSTDPVTEVAVLGADLGTQDSESRIAFSPYGDVYYFLDSSSNLWKMSLADDTPSADSPLAVGSDGEHILLPTKY